MEKTVKAKKGRPYKKKLMVYTFPITVVAHVGTEKAGAMEAWTELSKGILIDEVPVRPPKGWSVVPLEESMLNKLWTRNSCTLGQRLTDPFGQYKTIGEILKES